ncbi:hypothetical protein BGZ49_010192 [Haplosporangium sp. Z 27]|nr:hypothetical protein BGZ49_010192 [Haplosporangium sp. Z 27]
MLPKQANINPRIPIQGSLQTTRHQLPSISNWQAISDKARKVFLARQVLNKISPYEVVAKRKETSTRTMHSQLQMKSRSSRRYYENLGIPKGSNCCKESYGNLTRKAIKVIYVGKILLEVFCERRATIWGGGLQTLGQ